LLDPPGGGQTPRQLTACRSSGCYVDINVMHMKTVVTRYKSKYFPPIVDAKEVDFVEFDNKYNECREEMLRIGTWFEDGRNYAFRKATNKKIALGRMEFYTQFADFLFEKNNERFYLLDFMTRIELSDGKKSLLYYILSAEEIHINLEGVSKSDLEQATVGLGKLAIELTDIQGKYATAWEINQVFHRCTINHTYFHTGSELSVRDAYLAMGKKVPKERILDDNAHLVFEWKSTFNEEYLPMLKQSENE
jgi:hypothetical protein